MLRILLAGMLLARGLAAASLFTLSGQVPTEAPVTVALYGATSPFSDAALTDAEGHFQFKKLLAGTYTLAVFMPARGEARTTVEVGPGTADSRGRVALAWDLKDSDFVFGDLIRRRNSVSTRQLAIPEKAWQEYREAQKDLGKRNIESAVAHLERAVALAPQFAVAWNNLGTIAYQTQKYERAEECFRQALEQEPRTYEALVNLGGVEINLGKTKEALDYNLRAVLERPNDALANSQLGMTYFVLGNFDLGERYLESAQQIDPSHFSHPQLLLAEIHKRRHEWRRAADYLEDFLKHHPDWPDAAKTREEIAKLRR
jgi:tetratricopeptide (TPR) repeat protein